MQLIETTIQNKRYLMTTIYDAIQYIAIRENNSCASILNISPILIKETKDDDFLDNVIDEFYEKKNLGIYINAGQDSQIYSLCKIDIDIIMCAISFTFMGGKYTISNCSILFEQI